MFGDYAHACEQFTSSTLLSVIQDPYVSITPRSAGFAVVSSDVLRVLPVGGARLSAGVDEPSGPRWWGAVRECVVFARSCGRENDTCVLTCVLFDFGSICDFKGGLIELSRGALVEGVLAGALC